MKRRWRRSALLGSVVAVALLGSAAPAPAAVGDPSFTMSGFNDPCGVSVDPAGNFYVANYYTNSISIFKSSQGSIKQLAAVDPSGGPCAMASDSNSNLYVNNFHHDVLKFDPDTASVVSTTKFILDGVFHTDEPTGVAVDPGLNRVYVNARTHVVAYNTLGVQQLEFGNGVIEDGYGIAVSQFAGTAGLIYVPDAATETVKAFNASGLLISTFGAPGAGFPGFKSLRDAAIAVSKVSGEIYVADRIGPEFSERPESVIYVFDSTGLYKGRLKFNVIDGRPVGLAVDNSAGANQGRVYVTTGAAGVGSIYAYPPGSAVLSGFPAESTLSVASLGAGSGAVVSSDAELDCAATCSKRMIGGAEAELRAEPDPGSTFLGWSGAGCSGTGTCVVAMDVSQSVQAVFGGGAPPPSPPAQVAPALAPSAAGPVSKAAAARSLRAQQRRRAKQRRLSHQRAKQRRSRAKRQRSSRRRVS